MNRRGVTILTAALLLLGGGAFYANSMGGQAQPAITKTPPKTIAPSSIQLEITIDGGFAYIRSGANTLNIAYLEDFKYTGANDANPETAASTVFCDVPQMGTELQVAAGTIETPSPAPAMVKFDVKGAIITFPALASSPAPLGANRPARPATPPPFKPADPSLDSQWNDLRFVPSLLAEHGAKLHPKWRGMVNGYMVLRGGSLKAVKPDRYAGHTFNFRRGKEAGFEQAITDRTVYTVNVPAGRIEIELAEADSGLGKIVVKPDGTNTVRLKLTGLNQTTAKGPDVGEPLAEHCTFYQLFNPIPQPHLWLRPYVVAAPTGTRVMVPHTPGFFCPGDWF